MTPSSLSNQLHQIADALPPEATRDDVRYQAQLHASIARGVADVEARRVIPVEDLMKEFGVAE